MSYQWSVASHTWNTERVYVIYIFNEETGGLAGMVEMDTVPSWLRNTMVGIDEISGSEARLRTTITTDTKEETYTVAMFRDRKNAERVAAALKILEDEDEQSEDS